MDRTRWWRSRRVWQVLALALTVAASAYLLTAPIYQPETECSGGGSYSPTGELLSSWDNCDPPTSLVAAGALSYIAWVVAAIPLAVLPLAARGRAGGVLSAVSAVGLVLFVILGGFAIGPLFVPGALCAVVGATVHGPRQAVSAKPGARSADA